MQVFVISLLRSEKRREHAKWEMEKHSITFKFFDAVEVKDICDIQNYDSLYREKFFGRHLRNGEIGCYLSHYTLWQKAIDLNETICILEDDITICCENFNEILDTCSLFQDFDIIKLGGIFSRKFFLYKAINGIKLVKYWFDNMGTQGYIITPTAAKQLIKNSAKIRTPVDDFIASYALNKLNVLAIEPPVLKHLNESSDIGGRELQKKKMSVPYKIRREAYIQIKRAANLLFQAQYFLRSFLTMLNL